MRVGILKKSFFEIWRRLTDVMERLRIVLWGEDKMKDSQTALASIYGLEQERDDLFLTQEGEG